MNHSFDGVDDRLAARQRERERKRRQRERSRQEHVRSRRDALDPRDAKIRRRAAELLTQGFTKAEGRPRPGTRSLLQALMAETGLSRQHLHRILAAQPRSGRRKPAAAKVAQTGTQITSTGSANTSKTLRDSYLPPPSPKPGVGQVFATETALHQAIEQLPGDALIRLQEVIQRRLGPARASEVGASHLAVALGVRVLPSQPVQGPASPVDEASRALVVALDDYEVTGRTTPAIAAALAALRTLLER